MGRTSAKGRQTRVRQARLAAELTQAELAAAAGVTRQTIAAVEAGDYAPSVYLALAIASRLSTTVEALFAEQAQASVSAPAPVFGTAGPPTPVSSKGGSDRNDPG